MNRSGMISRFSFSISENPCQIRGLHGARNRIVGNTHIALFVFRIRFHFEMLAAVSRHKIYYFWNERDLYFFMSQISFTEDKNIQAHKRSGQH